MNFSNRERSSSRPVATNAFTRRESEASEAEFSRGYRAPDDRRGSNGSQKRFTASAHNSLGSADLPASVVLVRVHGVVEFDGRSEVGVFVFRAVVT